MIKELLNRFRWFAFIVAVIELLVGLYVIFNPGASLASMGIFLAIAVLVTGLSELFQYFSTERDRRPSASLASAIVTSLLGFWILTSSTIVDFATLIPSIIAFWILVTGILRLASGVGLNNPVFSARSLIWSGLALTILGAILMFHPLLAGAILVYMVGFSLLIEAIHHFHLFFHIGRIGK